jgi:hypothetical protein
MMLIKIRRTKAEAKAKKNSELPFSQEVVLEEDDRSSLDQKRVATPEEKGRILELLPGSPNEPSLDQFEKVVIAYMDGKDPIELSREYGFKLPELVSLLTGRGVTKDLFVGLSRLRVGQANHIALSTNIVGMSPEYSISTRLKAAGQAASIAKGMEDYLNTIEDKEDDLEQATVEELAAELKAMLSNMDKGASLRNSNKSSGKSKKARG